MCLRPTVHSGGGQRRHGDKTDKENPRRFLGFCQRGHHASLPQRRCAQVTKPIYRRRRESDNFSSSPITVQTAVRQASSDCRRPPLLPVSPSPSASPSSLRDFIAPPAARVTCNISKSLPSLLLLLPSSGL